MLQVILNTHNQTTNSWTTWDKNSRTEGWKFLLSHAINLTMLKKGQIKRLRNSFKRSITFISLFLRKFLWIQKTFIQFILSLEKIVRYMIQTQMRQKLLKTILQFLSSIVKGKWSNISNHPKIWHLSET